MTKLAAVTAALLLLSACRGAAPPLPSSEDRAGWRKLLNWSNDCEEGFRATSSGQSGLQTYALGGGRSLVQVACVAGAYQGSQEYFVIEGARPRAVSLTTFEAAGPEGTTLERRQVKEITGLAEFDPKTRLLRILNKYRGPGDCGSWAVYDFSGSDAQLKEFRAKVACDGEGAEHPEQWPLHRH